MARFWSDVPDPPPPTLWQGRLRSAQALVVANVTDPGILRRLDAVERALWTADMDRKRLAATLEHLDPDRASRELKSALRANFTTPNDPNQELVDSLQRRHETIHGLQDQIEGIERSIDRTVADVEQLAASSAQLALSPSNHPDARLLMEHLNHDLEILAKVHSDLADL